MPVDPRGPLQEAAEMSFLEHLEALRWHVMRSVVAILIGAVAAFFAKDFVFDTILLGPKNPDFWTYRTLCDLASRFGLSDLMCIREIPFGLINTSMSGQFTTHMMVSFLTGLVLAFPYIVWEIWRFVSPGLHAHERRYATGMVFYVSLLFMLGVLFGYYLITPMSVNFLGTYQVSGQVQNMIDLDSYFSTVATLVLACGLMFEMPVLMYFLTKVGVVSPEFLRNYRKHAVVIILFIAAVITPPDVASQILVFFPLMLLYELSIFVSVFVIRNKERTKG